MGLDISASAMDVALFCRLNANRKTSVPIRFSELGILIYIANAEEPVCNVTISDFFGVSKPTVSSTVKSLIQNGFVECIPSSVDRRSYSLKATDLGMKVADYAKTEYTHDIEALSNSMGEESFEQFISLIQKANKILKNMK